jgi:hypothetical protein
MRKKKIMEFYKTVKFYEKKKAAIITYIIPFPFIIFLREKTNKFFRNKKRTHFKGKPDIEGLLLKIPIK